MKYYFYVLAFLLIGCSSQPFSSDKDIAQAELNEYLIGLNTIAEIEKALKKKRFKCKSVSDALTECVTERMFAPLVCSKEGWLVKLRHEEKRVINKTIRYQYPSCL